MSETNVAQLLSQMRAMAEMAQGIDNKAVDNTAGPDFSSLLQQSVDAVNKNQQTAGNMAAAFEAGESGADLTEVMVAIQKANISFQSMVQVRNRLVSAYQDIMNMPI